MIPGLGRSEVVIIYLINIYIYTSIYIYTPPANIKHTHSMVPRCPKYLQMHPCIPILWLIEVGIVYTTELL